MFGEIEGQSKEDEDGNVRKPRKQPSSGSRHIRSIHLDSIVRSPVFARKGKLQALPAGLDFSYLYSRN